MIELTGAPVEKWLNVERASWRCWRFGPIPQWAHERLAARSAAELEDVSERLLDVSSVEDLLR